MCFAAGPTHDRSSASNPQRRLHIRCLAGTNAMTTVSRTIEALRRLAILALILGIVAAAAVSADPARAESTATPRDAAQIEALVAPIALYPDGLLAQVLMAST